MWRNSDLTFGTMSKTFHWLLFFLIVGMLIYGFCLGDVPKPYAGFSYNLHKLIGLGILLLMILRLLWKLTSLAPSLPMGTPSWQIFLDRVVQWLLYICIIAMPLSGWIGSAAMGRSPHLGSFVFNLPIASPNKPLADTAFELHENLAWIIITLIIVHTLAAFYHFFIKKDNVLQRMLPARRRK